MRDEPTVPLSGTPDEVHPGTQFGRYRVDGVLGWGGMGVVYRGHDPDLNRPVAIKVMRPRPGLTGSRLLREGQTIARLRHPNIVAVYDVGVAGDHVFIAMELVEEGTLRAWCATRRWREIVAMYAQAGRGLAAAHAAGLVHRDFKPDNVLVARDGRAVVGDFGLAEEGAGVVGDLPDDAVVLTTASIAGTPAYMAPEQLRGAPADARSDQWSFCVSLWESLFGTRPYDGANVAALAVATAAGRLRAIDDARGVPARMRAILRRGLSPSASDRFPSMDALVSALSARPGRRLAIAAVALVVSAVVAVALLVPRGGEARLVARPAVCDDGEIATVWNDAARARYLGDGTVAALADDARWFDEYASGIGVMHRLSCTRAQIAPADPSRDACLDGAVADLRAALARARPDAYWAALRPLASCAGRRAPTLRSIGRVVDSEDMFPGPGGRIVDSRPPGVSIRAADGSERQVPGIVEAEAWTASGELVGTTADKIRVVVDPSDGRVIRTLGADIRGVDADRGRAVWMPTDQPVVVGAIDGGPREELLPAETYVEHAAFSPDGTRVAFVYEPEHGGYRLRVHDLRGAAPDLDRDLRIHLLATGHAGLVWQDDQHLLLSGSVSRGLTQQHLWRLRADGDGRDAPELWIAVAPHHALQPLKVAPDTIVLTAVTLTSRNGIYQSSREVGVLPGRLADQWIVDADSTRQRFIAQQLDPPEWFLLRADTWAETKLAIDDALHGVELRFRGDTVVGLGLGPSGWRYFELDGARETRSVPLAIPVAVRWASLRCSAEACLVVWLGDRTLAGFRVTADAVTAVTYPYADIPRAAAWAALPDGGLVALVWPALVVIDGGRIREVSKTCPAVQSVEATDGRDVWITCRRESGTFSIERLALDGSRADVVLESPAWIPHVVSLGGDRFVVSTVEYDEEDEVLEP